MLKVISNSELNNMYFNCLSEKKIQPVVLTYIVKINDIQYKILNNIDLFPVSETKKSKLS